MQICKRTGYSLLFALAIALTLAACSFAADDDPALAQKITYSASDTPVRVVLEDLSKLTGVTLRAGQSSQDWQVRDRKMSIFAKDVSLSELMGSISRVMVCKWTSNRDKTPVTYRLIADKTALAEAQARADKYNKELTEKRRKYFSSLTRFDQLSPAQKAGLKVEFPALSGMAESPTGQYVTRLLKECPKLADALIQGQSGIVRSPELSAAAQTELLGAIQRLATARNEVLSNLMSGTTITTTDGNGTTTEQPLPESAWKSPEASAESIGSVIIEYNPDQYSRKADTDYGDLVIHYDDSSVTFRFYTAPDKRQDPSAPTISEAAEPVAEHPEDPALLAKIKLELTPTQGRPKISDFESALSSASGFAVVSDSFIPGTFDMVKIKSSGELKEVLNGFGEAARYNWWKNGSIIELRYRDWYARRLLQIPDSTLSGWRKSLYENGYLDIDTLSEIASCTTDQLEASLPKDDLLRKSGVIGIAEGYGDFLRLYGLLDVDQKGNLLSKDGLELKGLAPVQRLMADRVVLSKNPSLLQQDDLRFNLRPDKETAGVRYSVIIFTPERGYLCNWSIICRAQK